MKRFLACAAIAWLWAWGCKIDGHTAKHDSGAGDGAASPVMNAEPQEEGGSVEGGTTTTGASGAAAEAPAFVEEPPSGPGAGAASEAGQGMPADERGSEKETASASATSVRIRSTVSGCLAQAGSSRGTTARSPSRGPSPGGRDQPDSFQVTGQAGNVLIEQSFGHACCLEATTTAVLDGTALVVTTELTGDPCRCLCASTIRSSIPLDPGTYTVKIVHRRDGEAKERHVERAVVR